MWCIKMTEKIKLSLSLEIQQYLKQSPGFSFRRQTIKVNIENPAELNKQVWKNLFKKSSMQVTEFGYCILRYGLEKPCWDFHLEEINSYDVLKLERYLSCPFYLNTAKRTLSVFGDSIAAQLLLYGNDIRTFLDAQDGVSDRPVKPKSSVDTSNKKS